MSWWEECSSAPWSTRRCTWRGTQREERAAGGRGERERRREGEGKKGGRGRGEETVVQLVEHLPTCIHVHVVCSMSRVQILPEAALYFCAKIAVFRCSCLVCMTDCSCTYMYLYMYMYIQCTLYVQCQ